MLIATFRDTTSWVGRTITCEDERFVLEGHGPITPTVIVEYDDQEHLEWSSEGLRLWVYEQAAQLNPTPPAPAGSDSAVPLPTEPDSAEPALVAPASADSQESEAADAPRDGAPTPSSEVVLIATFREGTTRAGQAISFDGAGFERAGEGSLTVAEVMEHDRQEQLVWADTGLRDWVQEIASGSSDLPSSSAESASVKSLGAPGIGIAGFVLSLLAVFLLGIIFSWIGYAKAKREGRPTGLCRAGIIISFAWLALIIVMSLASIPMFTNERDKAKDAAVKEGIHSIQIGVQSFAVDHYDNYPSATRVKEAGMTNYVDNWPRNPYTGGPMTQGTGPGQFTYERAPDRIRTLTGYGKHGAISIVKFPGSDVSPLSQAKAYIAGLHFEPHVTTAAQVVAQMPKGMEPAFSTAKNDVDVWTYTFGDGSSIKIVFVIQDTNGGGQELRVLRVRTKD